jgi:hypothetical protein
MAVLTPRYLVDPTFGPTPNFPFCGNIRKPLPSTGSSGVNPSIQFESYAPYIIMRFQDPNTRGRRKRYAYAITTGNLAGENRSASIKSMTYQVNQSGTATVDIIDSSGNDFVNFYSSLFTNGCLPGTGSPRRGTPSNLMVALDFGWIFTGSSGVTTVYSNTFANGGSFPSKTGPYLYFILAKIDVNYEGGIWKYKVELKGADLKNNRRSASRTYGKQRQKVTLMDAASKHLSGDCTNPAEIQKTRLVRKNPDGTWSDANFENGGPNGPKGVYPGYNDIPESAIRKNLDFVVTDRSKGVFMFYNVADESQTLFLVEGSFDNCLSNRAQRYGCPSGRQGNYLGTYVINGGDISPVISFSPKIEINATPTNNTGAVASGSTRSRAVKIPSCTNNDPQAQQGATVVTQTSVRDNQLNSKSPKELSKEIAKNARATIEAAKSIMPTIGAVTADLTIQGDPRLVWPHQTQICEVSIVFVNPFALRQEFEAEQGSVSAYWLARPVTNPLLSKASCKVQEIEHSLSEGKWETKLKIVVVPGDEKKQGNSSAN